MEVDHGKRLPDRSNSASSVPDLRDIARIAFMICSKALPLDLRSRSLSAAIVNGGQRSTAVVDFAADCAAIANGQGLRRFT